MTKEVLFFVLSMFFIIFFIMYHQMKKTHKYHEMMDQNEKDWKEIAYCREIPCDNLDMAFWVGIHYRIIQNVSDFIGALILKWMKEDKIDIIQKDGKTVLDMNKVFATSLEAETQIYLILLGGSGPNRMLEEDELKFIFEVNHQKLEDIIAKLDKTIKENLIAQGYLHRTITDSYGGEKITSTPYLDDCAKKMLGLKKFLLHFSIIETRKSIESKLWDEYLIYAQLLGIADQVANELENIYPNYNQAVKIKSFQSAFVKSVVLSFYFTFSPEIFFQFIIDRDETSSVSF